MSSVWSNYPARTLALLAPVAALALGAAACSSEPSPAQRDSGSARATSTNSARSSAVSSSSGAVAPQRSSSAAAVASVMVSAPGAPVSVKYPNTPAPVAVEHGKEYWAVYLAVGPNSDALEQANRVWGATKLPVSSGESACDGGSKEAGVPEGSFVISVYFNSQDDAKSFAASVEPKPAAVGKVKILCAD